MTFYKMGIIINELTERINELEIKSEFMDVYNFMSTFYELDTDINNNVANGLISIKQGKELSDLLHMI